MTKPTGNELELIEAAGIILLDSIAIKEMIAEGRRNGYTSALMLARHVLATVHEDDDGPIGVDWLVNLGGRYASEVLAVDFVLHPPEPKDDFGGTTARILCYTQDDWVCELFDSDKSPCEGIGFGLFRTRGQVRKLFDVLGICSRLGDQP